MRVEAALAAVLALCLAMTSCGASGDGVKKDGETFLLRGTVGVVGNEPFARLVLSVAPTGGSGRPTDYAVKGPLAEELRSRHQGRVVTVECRRCGESAPARLPCIEPVRIIGAE